MEELPDSTDWIQTCLPAFEPLEAALRCEVCKEFYENPVITTCSHTFCSLCIRRCISNDGKCPACKSQTQADRLLPNYAMREIVTRFQDARPKALELARQNNDDALVAGASGTGKKRKIDETDIEEDAPTRQARSRITKSDSRREDGMADAPIEVPDSEEDGDGDFEPENGYAPCPMCKRRMRLEQMWLHIEKCPGQQEATGGRSTRSRANHVPSNLLIGQRKDNSSPPSRLPGLNYALLRDTALKKKLQDLGIPAGGNRPLLIKRHTEWLHLWNSNCDASEDRRKTKHDLLKELERWERLHGAYAPTTEAIVMRKDFDGQGHASAHKSQFDDLIANAKKKREIPKERQGNEVGTSQKDRDAGLKANGTGEHLTASEPQAHSQSPANPARPYEGNDSALATIREKVAQTNRNGAIIPSFSREASSLSRTSLDASDAASDEQSGIQDPFNSPSRKLPMFKVPEDPVVDMDSATIQ